MTKPWAKIKKAEWQEFVKVWRNLRPPWKPSAERIRIYRQLIKKYVKGDKALVLGATPEIRDLLAELKFKVTLLDINPGMVKAMTYLRKTKSREKAVIGDWLTGNPGTEYDLVIGDSNICNLLTKFYGRFFRHVNELLKDKGVFICQSAVSAKPLAEHRISIREIIKKAKYKPDYYENYLNRAHDYLKWVVSHTKRNVVNWGELNEIWRQKLKDGQISKKEFKLLDFGLPKKLILSFLNEKTFIGILKRHWQIITEKHEQTHRVYKDFYRIYILKKK